MNYTFFAIAWYIIMRALQVLFEEQVQQRWFRILIRVVAVVVLCSGLVAVSVWYHEIPLLGFDPFQ